MEKLNIEKEKVSNFHQLCFSDKRVICEQKGQDETTLMLTLCRVMQKGKHRIMMVGVAFDKEGKIIKGSDLGSYPVTKSGAQMVIDACGCYDYTGMYELIIH